MWSIRFRHEKNPIRYKLFRLRLTPSSIAPFSNNLSTCSNQNSLSYRPILRFTRYSLIYSRQGILYPEIQLRMILFDVNLIHWLLNRANLPAKQSIIIWSSFPLPDPVFGSDFWVEELTSGCNCKSVSARPSSNKPLLYIGFGEADCWSFLAFYPDLTVFLPLVLNHLMIAAIS